MCLPHGLEKYVTKLVCCWRIPVCRVVMLDEWLLLVLKKWAACDLKVLLKVKVTLLQNL
jgi:hypothetical protein